MWLVRHWKGEFFWVKYTIGDELNLISESGGVAWEERHLWEETGRGFPPIMAGVEFGKEIRSTLKLRCIDPSANPESLVVSNRRTTQSPAFKGHETRFSRLSNW